MEILLVYLVGLVATSACHGLSGFVDEDEGLFIASLAVWPVTMTIYVCAAMYFFGNAIRKR